MVRPKLDLNPKKTTDLKQFIVPAVLGLLIIIALILAYTISNKKNFRPTSTTSNQSSVEEQNLPDNWRLILEKDGSTLVKLERVSDAQYKPQIVLVVSSPKTDNPKLYTDSLISGARSTLPGLRYTKDNNLSKDNIFDRELIGYYYNSKRKIDLYQRLIIKDSKLFTLTMSYLDGTQKDEDVSQVVNYILVKYLNQ